jgi:hypothetical protein
VTAAIEGSTVYDHDDDDDDDDDNDDDNDVSCLRPVTWIGLPPAQKRCPQGRNFSSCGVDFFCQPRSGLVPTQWILAVRKTTLSDRLAVVSYCIIVRRQTLL